MEDTPSTMSSAGCLLSSMTLRTNARSLVTPVEVSLCTTHTALIFLSLSARRISSRRASSAASPHGWSMTVTSRPSRCIMSIQRCEKTPKRKVTTLSPGQSVLVSADSQPPVPVPGKMNGVPCSVSKIILVSSRIDLNQGANQASRWLAEGTAMARWTLSWMLTGPGTKRWLRPGGV